MSRAKDDPDDSQPMTKRSRWATRRLTVKSSGMKRLSLMARKHGRSASDEKRTLGGSSGPLPSESEQQQKYANEADGNSGEEHSGPGPRTLYFNLPLPDDLKDAEGHPLQKYTRNKIRTAKYTPLSFIPKNLWFQFHNIANIFFLFLVILDIFPIFGGTNPGLNAVPLIAITAITAVKDAVEDYRRTNLDKELNNAPVHRLTGWTNINVEEDNVSAWRRFKKVNTRFFGAMWHIMAKMWKKEKPAQSRQLTGSAAEPRPSMTTRPESTFITPSTGRRSFLAGEEYQMTPVQSPQPRQSDVNNRLQVTPEALHRSDGGSTSSSDGGGSEQMQNLKGDLINYQLPVAGTARFHRDAWKNLVVGDFVRIYSDDELPADIIVLATSDPDGACFVETKNLDGETNLKVRSALRCGRPMKHARDCERAEFVIESEPPQANLYKYNGAIRWKQKMPWDRNGEAREMTEPIGIDNLLLRGCNLRNTEWALGVVIFTGHDTKIMMNSGITPSKRPRIARELNFNVVCNFVILAIMCLIGAIANGIAWSKTDASLAFFEYGPLGSTPGLTGFINFWACVILFQNLVPISLYISLEIVRTLQAFFIYSDGLMYYEQLDQPCIPKTWNISDDVGQIEYIFSDKTGTLTQNVMEFKKATINGHAYGEAYTEAQAGWNKRMGVDVEAEAERFRAEVAGAKVLALQGLRRLHENPYLHDEDLTFIAPDFVEDLVGKNGLEQQHANEYFMLALALCHAVIAERQPGDPPKMIFKAQSPDEAALVATARDMGFTVLGNSGDGIDLNVMGEDRHYPILNTIEFNSTRKRMSVIVRMPDKRIILFCKGADSIIYSRLKRGEQRQLRDATARHLETFAVEGFRTLCIAHKELEEDEYQAWRRQHHVAATALEHREEKLEEVADRIERDLMLLGGTAIEDRLQDGVPDTIALLGDAGIKLWVLTGDKVETAINIGFSCNLLNNDMDLIRLQVPEEEDGMTDDEYMRLAEAEVHQGLAKFGITGSNEELKQARKDHEPPAPTHALVIDGFTLRWMLSEELRQQFLLLCKRCKSVLCCRVSPAQKAAVVAMVKSGLDVMTLSIGDGANDVAMIQEADVGVGIAGEEGRQAVMSSDYAIAQFRFLQRLVLVHGRWSYRRLAETISNFFYKNMVWTWAIFWYQAFTDFDISYVFDYTYILMFNLFFTSVPVVLMGVLDQDVNDAISLAVPQLYRRGIERIEWTQTKFWAYMVDGVYQSVMSFFVPYCFVVLTFTAAGNGMDVSDRVRLGCYIAHPAVLTINLYILINTYRWDWLMLLVIIISDLFIFFWTGLYTSLTFAEFFYHAAPQVYGQLSFWMVLVITPAICIFPRFAVKCMQKTFWPYDVDIIREQEKLGVFAHLDHEGSAAAVAKAKSARAEANANRRDPDRNGLGVVSSSTSSEASATLRHAKSRAAPLSLDEDRRPIYPASVSTTHNTGVQRGSDGTEYTIPIKYSVDLQRSPEQSAQPLPEATPVCDSTDRVRLTHDRARPSMDRMPPSFEASNDFTSAARLGRIESCHSVQGQCNSQSENQRRFNLTTVRKRGLSAFSKKSTDQ